MEYCRDQMIDEFLKFFMNGMIDTRGGDQL